MKKVIVAIISILPLVTGYIAGIITWFILLAWNAIVEGFEKGRNV
jgi:hypothetical protein